MAVNPLTDAITRELPKAIQEIGRGSCRSQPARRWLCLPHRAVPGWGSLILLAAIGSWKDTQPDEAVLQDLPRWNAANGHNGRIAAGRVFQNASNQRYNAPMPGNDLAQLDSVILAVMCSRIADDTAQDEGTREAALLKCCIIQQRNRK
jgi:hypothetical protein